MSYDPPRTKSARSRGQKTQKKCSVYLNILEKFNNRTGASSQPLHNLFTSRINLLLAFFDKAIISKLFKCAGKQSTTSRLSRDIN